MIADNIVQGTPLAAVNDGTQIVLFYQRAEGVFRVLTESIDGGEIQKEGTDVSTITGSPIAPVVIDYLDGPEITAYYIAEDYTLTEYPDILGEGQPQGLSVKANPNAGLAAVAYITDEKIVLGLPVGIPRGIVINVPILHKTVFYQDFETNEIRALTWRSRVWWQEPAGWGDPKTVPVDPFVGTALAAAVRVDPPVDTTSVGPISVQVGKATIRLYYQDKDITLQESIFDGKNWSEGKFKPGDIALQSPLAATAVGNTVLVYYRELGGGSYVGREPTSSKSGDGAITTEITEDSEYRHTAVQVEDTLRFYYQVKAGYLAYRVGNLDGKKWKDPTA
jgi:hypothetical protein